MLRRCYAILYHRKKNRLNSNDVSEPCCTNRYAGNHSRNGDGYRYDCLPMEIAIEETIPTYSGGLGMLAGDTVRLQPTWNSNSSP